MSNNAKMCTRLVFRQYHYAGRDSAGKACYCVIGALLKSYRIPFGPLGYMKPYRSQGVKSSILLAPIKALIEKSGVSIDELNELQFVNDRRGWRDLASKLWKLGVYDRVKKYAWKTLPAKVKA